MEPQSQPNSVELKLKRATYCLYAAAAVQGLSIVFSIFSMLEFSSLDSLSPSVLGRSASLFGFAMLWPLAVLTSIYFVIQNLKTQNEWAWLGALSIFLFTLPSFSIVFSVLGILNLLDQDVRSIFLKKLDVKI